MKLFVQHDAVDCGPACIKMIAHNYGKNYSLQFLREKSYLNREGVSLDGISDAADFIGLKSVGARLSLNQLKTKAILPCILHWEQNHFVVLYKIKNDKFYIADPASNKVKLDKNDFLEKWIPQGQNDGILLLLEPTPEFYNKKDEKESVNGLNFVFFHLKKHSKLVIQLLLGLLVISTTKLAFPFLTQAIVDQGVSQKNIGFLEIILAAQIVLFASQALADLVRQWALLHLGTRVSVSIISDFLIKLLKLPISFFDSKTVGDLFERVGDHSRIQNFIASSSINIFFNLITVLLLGIVLFYYSTLIFTIFFIGSFLYFVFILQFLSKRKTLDYQRFAFQAKHQGALLQILSGITDIKINGAGNSLRWDWEAIQAKIFRINIKTTRLLSFQSTGASFINELQNVLITFVSAKLVIENEMTLGMMLAIQYIIGQLNVPLSYSINFIHELQDAKISLDRISEVRSLPVEKEKDLHSNLKPPEKGNINIDRLTFQYGSEKSRKILDDVTIEIPLGKVTAIVGPSGSGKTTLMKLLLKIYNPSNGKISVNGVPLTEINGDIWRSMCGVVMQDGFIFSDTISKNISIGSNNIDEEELNKVLKIANIEEFVQDLPLGLDTKIGSDGLGLSQGQKQRVLIARAIYNNPDYLFFDEATSALDTENESEITENLAKFFDGKTAIVIAHRLSTVKNSDQIIVMDKGRVVEIGSHKELVKKKGKYYSLIRNQLEMG